MAAQWPSELQQLLLQDGFGIEKGSTVVRTEMDIGPKKTRRRFTKGVDVLSGAIDLTIEQYQDFEFFYDTTLAGGSLPFEFPHPITQELKLYKFDSEPRYVPLGGVNFRVSFTWEQLPA